MIVSILIIVMVLVIIIGVTKLVEDTADETKDATDE